MPYLKTNAKSIISRIYTKYLKGALLRALIKNLGIRINGILKNLKILRKNKKKTPELESFKGVLM